MSILDSIKKIFGRELEPGEQYKKNVDATHKQLQRLMANEKAQRDHITKCVQLMKECRYKFNASIMNGQDMVNKKTRTGLPVDQEKTRMREAAIGILTVDMALLDLESISTEKDLNRAMNNVGKALRQLIRLDSSTATISGSARNFVDTFYPGFKELVDDSENFTAIKKATNSAKKKQPTEIVSIYEIPQEIRDRIDDTFVENLMAGDNYDMAMFKAQQNPVKKSNTTFHTSGGLSEEERNRLNTIMSQADDDDSIVNS